MAQCLVADGIGLAQYTGDDGEVFFEEDVVREALPLVKGWETVFTLETMELLDQTRIQIQERGAASRREFGHLSAGQQRSVLLSVMLCADRFDPLVLDQPEDHLDGQYIASALVGHLEAAKERRQVILATHSPNLTVLGDAELVVPLFADAGRGAPRDPGAVDRPETREHVCALLEGGTDAFRRRGERYGFHFRN